MMQYRVAHHHVEAARRRWGLQNVAYQEMNPALQTVERGAPLGDLDQLRREVHGGEETAQPRHLRRRLSLAAAEIEDVFRSRFLDFFESKFLGDQTPQLVLFVSFEDVT